MKTKNRKGPTVVNSPQAAPATIEDFATVEQRSEEPKKKERFQLSFDLNDDGSPDLTGMREGTKRKVIEFFSDQKLASAFGVKAVEKPTPNFFPKLPEQKYPPAIGSLYNVISMVEILGAQAIFKIPMPIAQRAFMYTETEKEALSDPTVKVLNKHMPDWMIKYQDEIMLGSMFLTITMAKVQLALALKSQLVSTPQTPSQEESKENAKKEGVN